jgi:hypothetical protein
MRVRTYSNRPEIAVKLGRRPRDSPRRAGNRFLGGSTSSDRFKHTQSKPTPNCPHTATHGAKNQHRATTSQAIRNLVRAAGLPACDDPVTCGFAHYTVPCRLRTARHAVTLSGSLRLACRGV